MENVYAHIAVARPLREALTYRVPEEMQEQLQPGMRVRVPLGRSKALGFYLGVASNPPDDLIHKIRDIDAVLELEPSLTPDVFATLQFAANHYRYSLGEALKAAMPPSLTQDEPEKDAKKKVIEFVSADVTTNVELVRRAPAQHAALSYLLAVGGRANVEEVAHAIPGARASLKKLEEKKLVVWETVDFQAKVAVGLHAEHHRQLTPEQQIAVERLGQLLNQRSFSPVLLHGVTGSGKTEVYLQLVEQAVAMDLGALILVPEIALTPQLVGRFRSRFGPQVAMLHSALKNSERFAAWQALRRGEVKIAVGVRSAVFAPVPNLGLLVVDEEHDPSFKQEDKLRYQARDLAVVRASKVKCLLVLGSATPSLETYENARKGKYETILLTKRVDDRPMPKVEMVDMRIERPRDTENVLVEAPILSPQLKEAMARTLNAGQQVILFLNRRGHSTFVLCEVCGETLKCNDCDVCLTHHASMRQLICHYCGISRALPEACPKCNGPMLRLGVGTERVEAEVADLFPKARVARLDRDAVRDNEQLTDMLSAFARREIDVLVGTQMVAKGHDFPGVTLVCVVLADTALGMPDFRAAERTFHLLTQVAGRAGRGTEPGRVYIQSYNPEAAPIHHVLDHDYESFSVNELKRRKMLMWPPYGRLALIRVEGLQPQIVAKAARRLAMVFEQNIPDARQGVRLLGPAPAPIAKVKGAYRWQLLAKAPTHAAFARPLDAVERAIADLPGSIKASIDVDPGAFL